MTACIRGRTISIIIQNTGEIMEHSVDCKIIESENRQGTYLGKIIG